jgi:hypothetical protein
MGPHETTLNVDLEPTLVELAAADDVCCEAWDVVGVEQSLVLPVLACKKDGATPLDPHDGTIVEPHYADNIGVEIREDVLDAGHVVGGPYVEDPLLGVSLSHLS